MTDEGKPTVTVPIGGVWEGSVWEIQFDVGTSSFRYISNGVARKSGDAPCPHAIDITDEEPVVYPAGKHGRLHEAVEVVTRWTVPRVVVMENEAGHNSTGVCLDCIVDWAANQ